MQDDQVKVKEENKDDEEDMQKIEDVAEADNEDKEDEEGDGDRGGNEEERSQERRFKWRQFTYQTVLENPFQCLIQMLFIPITVPYHIISYLVKKLRSY